MKTIIASLMILCAVHANAGPGTIRVGADILIAGKLDLVRGKHLGIITNHTGRLSNGTFLVDTLRSLGIDIVALFGPEHGVRGVAAAGESVGNSVDEKTGIPVFSLYGSTNTPTTAVLKGIDLLVYDIQDVGARFYTYITTMKHAMEAAAEHHIPFLVLDRPNPLGGQLVEGPIIDESHYSFVGSMPVPIVYGLTCGELARMIAGEGWLPNHARPELTVIPIAGWTRSMHWDSTGLTWIAPSPNLPTYSSAVVYPGTCLVEATNCSEGRGTSFPFETIGAPGMDGELLIRTLNALRLPGIAFSTVSFTPTTSKYDGQECSGIRLHVTNGAEFSPVTTGIALLEALKEVFPSFSIRSAGLARLYGSTDLETDISMKASVQSIVGRWRMKSSEFRELSKKYYLYPD